MSLGSEGAPARPVNLKREGTIMSCRITRIFAECLGLDPSQISDETSPDNTPQWDSLNSLKLVVAIQDAFSIELTFGEIMAMRDVGLVRSILRKKGVAEA